MRQRQVEVRPRIAEETFREAYRQLNSRQREAVDAIEGPVMVLAGPGTGKTQVLTMRAANILRRTQMDPWNILCLTFTESAAVEMRQRLYGLIGEAAYQVRISTFHSFCNEVIKEWPDKFMQPRAPAPDEEETGEWQALSDVERVQLFRRLVDQLPAGSPLKPFGRPYYYVRDLTDAVRRLKQEDVSYRDLKEVLDKTEQFVEAAAGTLEPFFSWPAARRTDEACRRVREEVGRVASSHGAGRIWQPLESSFVEYDRSVAGLTEREASKFRTGLKNEWKKYFNAARKQLPRQRDMAEVYRGYQAELERLGRYDFEDMIMKVVRGLKKDDELLAYYQEQFQYVLVDEYQDTNGAQNEAVDLLGSYYPNPNIFVVGDDKQSIFRFQGASLENLLHFYDKYQEYVRVISLSDNYRSQQVILNAAAEVIAHNTRSAAQHIGNIEINLVAGTAAAPAKLRRAELDTMEEEAYFTAREARRLIEDGVDPDQMAILYKYNREADELLEVMTRLKVPARLEAGEDVLRDIKVNQFLKLLTYLSDIKDDEALAEILPYDFWGLDELDTVKVLYYAGRRRWSGYGGRLPALVGLGAVISQRQYLKEAGVSDTRPWLELARKLARWRGMKENTTLQHFFSQVLQESELLEDALRQANLPLLRKITALFEEVRKLGREQPGATLAHLMQRLKILEESGLALRCDPWRTNEKGVRLMTVHKAKGLEFDYVFLVNVVDGHWGNTRQKSALALPPGLLRHGLSEGEHGHEEERRLFYVALTRGRRQVYITSARRDRNGRARLPSLFAREISAANVEVVEIQREQSSEALAVDRLAPARKEGTAVDVRAWLAANLENYVMSVTHLNNYLRCPRLFYYRNVLRAPSAKTKHMAFGTAVHAALKDLFTSYQKEGRLPDRDYLLERFQRHLKMEDLVENERSEVQQLGRGALEAYYEACGRSWTSPSLVEYDFRSHGVNLEGVGLTGKLDKIEIREGNQARVVDYKTGNPDSAGGKLREGGDYRRQLVFYKLIGDLSPRFKYEIVAGSIHFIQPSKRTGRLVRKEFGITEREVSELKQEVIRVGREIKELKFLDAEGCGECEYCTTPGVKGVKYRVFQ